MQSKSRNIARKKIKEVSQIKDYKSNWQNIEHQVNEQTGKILYYMITKRIEQNYEKTHSIVTTESTDVDTKKRSLIWNN